MIVGGKDEKYVPIDFLMLMSLYDILMSLYDILMIPYDIYDSVSCSQTYSC